MEKAFWLIPSFVIGFGAQLYTFVLYKVDRPYDATENAVFGILQPTLFVIPLACLICVSVVSGIGKPLCRSSISVRDVSCIVNSYSS